MTVYYRLIGTGETDANGVASYTYQGTGKGEVDLIASTSNPIGDSSLVSETYSIFDCRYYDEGTLANHNDSMWASWMGTAICTRNADYTSITTKEGEGAGSWQITNCPFTNDELTVEFDVYVDGTGTPTFAQIRNQGYNVLGNITLGNMNLSLNQWHHIILQFKTDYVYISNTTNTNTNNRSLGQEVNKFMIRNDTTSSETRYKNFKVY